MIHNQVGYNYTEAHTSLRVVNRAGPHRKGKVRATFAASTSAKSLGFDPVEMVAVVLSLNPGDFYKSMTTSIDDNVWQDVYRPSTRYGDIYLKLTVVNDVLIVSFKEL